LEGQVAFEGKRMNIGEAAKATGVPAKMIRYYESIGLLPPPNRTGSGYRSYDGAALHRLRFVRRARDFAFSMKQIKALLRLWSDHKRPSREVKAIALGHVAELNMKIEQLTQLRDVLADLAHRCSGDHRPHCPILHDLERDRFSPEA
jgi:MerR family copper efflux transcriptional regulator